MIDILIFSFNRAAQLDLCIRTINEKLNFSKRIFIQYRFSNSFYKNGYTKLISQYNNVKFLSEQNFKNDFLGNINLLTQKYCMFLTDDDVAINNVSSTEIKNTISVFENRKDVSSISFRMNPNINYCYPAKKNIAPPSFIHNDKNYLLWNWTSVGDLFCCWGYPMSINSHVYNTNEITGLLKTGDFSNVNGAEDFINRNRFYHKPLMMSFSETKIFNVQNNFVQGPRIKEVYQRHSIENLNHSYLSGNIIDTKNIYGMKNTMAHGIIEYKFKKG